MEGNVPAYYRDVSLRLFNVLDKVGLSEDIRWKRINMILQAEEIVSIFCKCPHQIFGSQAEATTTQGLKSDLDIVECPKRVGVLQSIPSLETYKLSYLMVCDASTPPGYVKLQMLDRGSSLPLFDVQRNGHSLDSLGRSVLCSRNFHHVSDFERHGPADTRLINRSLSMDRVLALRVRSWPCQASQWGNEINNYPSQANIFLVKETGALIVPVGHPFSPESHLEWRISISYGEKILVWQFNSTQYKCYVLLKMIKKHFVQPICREKGLSSYHCKTCVFYTLQSTPSSLWQPENLLLCVELCLRKLCQWVKIGYCPNYFIPGENMFHGKVYGHIQVQLLAVLHDLLRQEGKYLLRLSYDGLGQRLTRLCQTSLIDSMNQVHDGVESMGLSIYILTGNIQQAQMRFACEDMDNKIGFVKKICSTHTTIQTVLTVFCSSGLGSDLASQCLSQDVIDQDRLDIAHELLTFGCSSDVTSGRLKLAVFYLMQDNLIMAENVLHQIQDNYTYLVADCRTNPPAKALCQIRENNLSTAEFVRQYIALPVCFSQSEIHCMPKALILKIFISRRSYLIDTCPPQCACVDPTFFLHYLECQCNFLQGKTSHKMAALYNMIWDVFYKNLKFMDSALSLLASCLMQDGKYMNAWTVLCISMRLQNEHNAAMWQIAFLINDAFRLLRLRQ
ncbi:hypothetical protein ACJMK2_014515 [Sinanodonta woodiana]|uniref:Mab-21-like HhH/H2TH-like domain-containing protein n=1 Tax=Sinanodonta woodiana TaxID=1069815 RepID=A0ABD3V0Y7_SINWO